MDKIIQLQQEIDEINEEIEISIKKRRAKVAEVIKLKAEVVSILW